MIAASVLKAPLLYAVAFFLIVAPFLGWASFSSSTEAREAHVMKAVLERGEWILPLRNGILPSKPPLHHWIGACLAALIGRVNEFTARLPSLLFATLLIGVTIGRSASLAGRYFGPHTSAIGALACATVLSTSYLFIHLAYDARVDMTFAFFVTAALFVMLQPLPEHDSAQGDKREIFSTRRWNAFFALCALATLAKGPLGIVLPGIVCAACLVCRFGLWPGLKAFLTPRYGWLIYLAITLPWYLGAISLRPDAFVERQIIFENYRRFFGGEFVNTEALWYYLPSFLVSCAPWSAIFAALFLRDLYLRRFSPGHELTKGAWPYALWIITVLIFFSAASGKRHSYLLPLAPALAVYVALQICRAWQNGCFRELFTLFFKGVSYFVCALGVAMLGLCQVTRLAGIKGWAHSRFDFWPLVETRLAGLYWYVEPFLILVVAVNVYLLIRNLHPQSAARFCAWFCASAIFSLILAIGLTFKADFKGFAEMAGKIYSIVGGEAKLTVLKEPFDELMDPVLFYLGREVQISAQAGNIRGCDGERSSVLAPNFRDYVLIRRKNYEQLPRETRLNLQNRPHYTVNQRYDEIKGRRDRELILVALC